MAQGDHPVNEKKTILERGLDWCFQQGTSTVLLLGLFMFVWINGPKHIQAIQEGYEKLVAKFESEQEKTRDSYDRSIKAMREEHKLDRESMRSSLRELEEHTTGSGGT
jgi:hypothetical protein